MYKLINSLIIFFFSYCFNFMQIPFTYRSREYFWEVSQLALEWGVCSGGVFLICGLQPFVEFAINVKGSGQLYLKYMRNQLRL